jgi:hypothetical protein
LKIIIIERERERKENKSYRHYNSLLCQIICFQLFLEKNKKLNLFLYQMIDNKYSEEIKTKVAIIKINIKKKKRYKEFLVFIC